ncbi:MAG TPA: NAD-dependent epimerase/dehydratase family protein [Mycobacteriales bacterium]|nr:NAD-dependent epimerase/dehydratase family protein [Mycobacteriales bacterium]
MRVLVTGATGLLGQHVVRAALDAGHEVRAVVRRRGTPLDALPSVRQCAAPITDVARLAAAMENVEVVVHCAAVYAYGADRAAEVEQVNVVGTQRVVGAAAAAGVRRVVVTSSSVTCGSSVEPVPQDETGRLGDEVVPRYFTSKVRQEQAALAAGESGGVEVVLAAPTVVLGGPADRLVPSNAIVLRYLLDPVRGTYPGGCNVVGVRDAAAGHLLLLEHGAAGERYLLGGENVSWCSLHATISDLVGVPGPLALVPMPVAYAASAAAEAWARLTARDPLSTREEALTIGRWHWYSSAKAAALGYVARPARAAVAESLAWLLVGPHLPRWVREGLRVSPEVRAARPLVPRPLVP